MTTISSSSLNRHKQRPHYSQSKVFCIDNVYRLFFGVVLLVFMLHYLWNSDDKPLTTTSTQGDEQVQQDDMLPSNKKSINSTSKSFENDGMKTRMEQEQQATEAPTPKPIRVLVFDADPSINSQEHLSVGQLMQGLLAAQLLGMEFDRTVCVKWNLFWQAFDYAQPEQAEICEQALATLALEEQETPDDNANQNKKQQSATISVWKDEPFVDECQIYDKLDSRQFHVVKFQGNTYPGKWRTDIPSELFEEYYKPKPALQQSMPTTKPKLVIHLRSPDHRDLDEEMLYYLGELLHGGSNYLVTNQPGKYADRFQDCCGWSYDLAWSLEKPIRPAKEETTESADKEESRVQALKMWLDWYIMLQAPRLYHTPYSSFAESALHWGGPRSNGYQLNGLTEMTTHANGRPNKAKVLKLDQLDKKHTKKVPSLVDREQLNSLSHCLFAGKRKPGLRKYFRGKSR